MRWCRGVRERASPAATSRDTGLCFFGHHHVRLDAEVAGVPCIGLNLVGHPGHLVAFEMTAANWRVLGEWP